MADKQQEVFEFAYYSLNPDKRQNYISNYRNFSDKIANIDGYKSLVTFIVIDDENLILDFTKWESLKKAEEADSIVQNSEEFNKYFEPVNEILFFDNLILLDEISKEETANYKIAELNLYEVNLTEIDTFNKNRKKLYNYVKENIFGFKKVLSFYSPEDDRINIDLVFWENLDSVTEAQKKLSKIEYFQKIFHGRKNIL